MSEEFIELIEEGKNILVSINKKLEENYRDMMELEFYIKNSKDKKMINKAKNYIKEYEEANKKLVEAKYDIKNMLDLLYTKTLLDFNNINYD